MDRRRLDCLSMTLCVMSSELRGVNTRDLNVRFIMSGQSRGKCNLRGNYVWAESRCNDNLMEPGPVLGQFVSLQPDEFIVGSSNVSEEWPTAPCRHLLVIIGPGSGGWLPLNIIPLCQFRRDPGSSPDLGGVWWHSERHSRSLESPVIVILSSPEIDIIMRFVRRDTVPPGPQDSQDIDPYPHRLWCDNHVKI